jgi:hypothetical protein
MWVGRASGTGLSLVRCAQGARFGVVRAQPEWLGPGPLAERGGVERWPSPRRAAATDIGPPASSATTALPFPWELPSNR